MKDNRPKATPAEPAISIDAILSQLASLKDNAESFISGSGDFDEVWHQDIIVCEAATAILSALQDEGIKDPEQVRDLLHDYTALAEQYQKLHLQFEEGAKPERFAGVHLCPKCRKQMRPGNNYCWNCGKRLDWRE